MEAKVEKQANHTYVVASDPEPLFPELIPVESHVNAKDERVILGSVVVKTVTDDDNVYDRFSRGQKRVFVAILSFCAILSPISSMGSLTAVPEIADAFGTTGSVINISNGLYTAAMGLSAFLWGALSTLSGRRIVLLASVVSFFLFSLGTALSPNLSAFFTFRTLSGFGGTGLLVTGPGVIGDLYRPVSMDFRDIEKGQADITRPREPQPWGGFRAEFLLALLLVSDFSLSHLCSCAK